MQLQNALVTNPLSLLETLVLEEPYRMHDYPEIWLCDCELAQPPRTLREAVENNVVDLVSKQLGNAKKITILSLGSGGCFQELILHAKISRVFKGRINWILVDTKYKTPAKTVQTFHMLAKSISQNTEVKAYDSDVSAFKKLNKRRPDIILNIDGIKKTESARFKDAPFPHIWAAIEAGQDGSAESIVTYYDSRPEPCRIS